MRHYHGFPCPPYLRCPPEAGSRYSGSPATSAEQRKPENPRRGRFVFSQAVPGARPDSFRYESPAVLHRSAERGERGGRRIRKIWMPGKGERRNSQNGSTGGAWPDWTWIPDQVCSRVKSPGGLFYALPQDGKTSVRCAAGMRASAFLFRRCRDPPDEDQNTGRQQNLRRISALRNSHLIMCGVETEAGGLEKEAFCGIAKIRRTKRSG